MIETKTLIAFFFSGLLSNIAAIQVTTPSGQIRGAISPKSGDVIRFLGVPYANPPTRFEKAELITPWEGE